ncbi:MAG: O-antigen ligase family protein [Patescibacteria group bacterium]|nr:O-antigen ligase family protein [Patescibacteria group bacterium]
MAKTMFNTFSKKLFGLFLLALFLLPLERIGSFTLAGLNIRVSQVLVIIILFLYALYHLYKKEWKIKLPLPLALYILFLLAGLISICFAREKARGLIVLAFWLFTILVPLATIISVNTKRRLKITLYFFLISAFVFSLFGFLQFGGDMLGLPASLTGLSARYTKEVLGFPRIQSTFIEPLYFANYLLIPLALSFFFILKRIDPKKNIYFAILFLVFLATLILTISKGAILALVIMACGVMVFQIRSVFSKKNIPYVFFIVLFILLAGWGTYSSLSSKPDIEKYYTKAYDIVTGASISERQEAYANAWEAFSQSPVTGIGVGNFGPYFSGYPAFAPDFGWPIANNQYLEILSETGVIGFLFFLIFLVSIFYYSVKAYWNTNDVFLKTVLLALNFAFLGVLIQYMTFSTLYIMHIWILIGLILAAQNIILNNKNEKDN